MSVAHIVIRLRESLDKQQLFTHQEWRSERNKIVTGSHDRDASLVYFTLAVLEDPEYTAIALTLCAGLAHVIRWLAYAVYLVTRWVAVFYLQEPALVDALFERGLILNIRRLMSFDDSLLASLAAGLCITIVFITYFRLADRSVRRTIEGDRGRPSKTMNLLLLLFLPPLYVCDWWIDIANLYNPIMAVVSAIIIILCILSNVHTAYALINVLYRHQFKFGFKSRKSTKYMQMSANHCYIQATFISIVVVFASIAVRKQTFILDPVVELIHTEFGEITLSLIMTYSICTSIMLTYRVKIKPKLMTYCMTAKDWLANDIRVALVVVIILVLLLFPFTPSILIDLSILSGI